MPAVLSDTLTTRLELVGVSAYVSQFQQVVGALGLYEGKLNETQRRQLAFGIGSGAIGLGIVAGLGKAVQSAGRLEQIEIGLQGVEGSAEAAATRIEELRAFDKVSPLDFEQTAASAQQLRGMGAAGKDVIPILTSLGNATAAAGRGQGEFSRSVLAVSQILSKGKLQGDELLQLAEAGVPLNDLMKELGTSFGEVGKAGITSERFIAALVKTMSQGRFSGAMEAQSRTLNGSLSTLHGTVNQVAAAIGKPWLDPTVAVVRGVTATGEAVNNLPVPVITAFSHSLGVASVALVGLGLKKLNDVRVTAELAAENVRLQNSLLGGSSAAKSEGAAAGALSGSLNKTGTAAGGAAGMLSRLNAEHQIGIGRAEAHALAIEGLGRSLLDVTLRASAASGALSRVQGPGSKGIGTGGGIPSLGSLPHPEGFAARAATRPILEPNDLLPFAYPHAVSPKGLGDKGTGELLGAAGALGAAAAGFNAREALSGLKPGAVEQAVKKGAASGVTDGLGKGGGLGKFGGPAALGAAFLGDLAVQSLPDDGGAGTLKAVGSGALQGATTGALIGSAFSPLGTAIGAGVGAVGGGGLGFFTDSMQKDAERKAQEKAGGGSGQLLAETQKTNALLERIAENTGNKRPLGLRDVSGGDQQAILNAMNRRRPMRP